MPLRTPRRYHADYAWLGYAALSRHVLIEIDEEGRFSAITPEVYPAPPDAFRLPGLALPGLANAHSHAFHRALRGRTHDTRGSFWTWRSRMYELAGRLDPDSYRQLATAVYAEMALAGVTCVGEFHYLHHDPDGNPYAAPNAMGDALLDAAAAAGIRITLLDTLYLSAGVDAEPLTGVQRRFSDGHLDGWLDRSSARRVRPHVRLGAAVHSVRAVPADVLVDFAKWHDGGPMHVHLSEQPAENDACRARYGCSPTELLDRVGLLGPDTTAVHATHVSERDIALLGASATAVCLCPTTERDLADGLGVAGPLAAAGSPLCVGTDSHARIDIFVEARLVELHERLRTGRRVHFGPAELLHSINSAGHAALGWTDAGTITVGARADLVAVRLDSVRTAGIEPIQVVFAADASDVTHVVVDGRLTVADGRHATVDVPAALSAAIARVTG